VKGSHRTLDRVVILEKPVYVTQQECLKEQCVHFRVSEIESVGNAYIVAGCWLKYERNFEKSAVGVRRKPSIGISTNCVSAGFQHSRKPRSFRHAEGCRQRWIVAYRHNLYR
jgi:hypothetical protein